MQPRADGGTRLDDTERTDLDIRPDLGRGADNRRWMNAHGRHLLEGLRLGKASVYGGCKTC